MKKSSKYLRNGLGAAIMIGSLFTSVSHAQQIGMESSSSGSALGILAQALASPLAANGVDIQLSLDQTLTRSLLKIGSDRLDSAFVPPLAYASLKTGEGPYAELGDDATQLAENVRSLFAVPSSYYHAITWADENIRDWSDAKNRRVYIGPPAGAANAQITGLVEAGGLQEGEYTAIKAPWGAATQGFQDGQYDVYVSTFALGSQALAELSLSRDIYLLSVGNVEPPENLGMQLVEIEPNTYPGQANEETVYTWQTLMMMAVNKNLSEEAAYQITKTYFEQRDTIARSNTVLAQISDSAPFAGLNVPLHPGAVRYYEEAGIAIPEALLPQQQ